MLRRSLLSARCCLWIRFGKKYQQQQRKDKQHGNGRAIAQIAKRQYAVGKERDKLEDLIADLESLKNDCDDAYGALQDARDALSRLL